MKLISSNLTEIYRSLYIGLDAGLTYERCFKPLLNSKNRQKKRFARIILQMLEKGNTFSEAADKLNISNLDKVCISAGEKAGRLTEVFLLLSDFHFYKTDFSRKINNELLYPKFLLFSAIIGGFIITSVTNGEVIYTDLLIQLLKAIIVLYILKKIVISQIFKEVLIFVPYFKEVVKKTEIIKISSVLLIMLKSGLSFTEAILVAEKSADTWYFKRKLNKCNRLIYKGEEVGTAFRKSFKQSTPSEFIAFLETAQESGSYDLMLKKITEYYTSEVIFKFKGSLKVVKGAVIAVIGLVIIFILLKSI